MLARQGQANQALQGREVAWLADPANWVGSGSIPQRLAEHLRYTGLAVLVASLIAVPLAAATSVLMRHALDLYLASDVYHGHNALGGPNAIGLTKPALSQHGQAERRPK